MKAIHTPTINLRYWVAITLASVFGTNMGDFYAHESGLGIVKGLAVLAFLTAVVFVVERFDNLRHQVWYWMVIILIRTGATNIADYLAFHVRIPGLYLTVSLAILIVLFGWGTHRAALAAGSGTLPKTNAAYWLAMLSAGVFGTVLGDICEHTFGEGTAAIGLTILLVIVLAAGFRRAAQMIAIYWTIVAVARTAGTAIGDWLAENEILHIGLPLCTLGSGIAFVAILLFWRSTSSKEQPLLQQS